MKTREAWNLKKFKMRRSRRHEGLRKFNFLLSAKQTKQGKKKYQVEMGAGRPDKCCQEPETKGHT